MQGRFQFSEEIKDSSLKSWLCLSSPKDEWKRGVGAIGRELPYLCSCGSGSNHAVRFSQSSRTALIARDGFRREWWCWRGRRGISLQRKEILAIDALGAGALTASRQLTTAASAMSINGNMSNSFFTSNIPHSFSRTTRHENRCSLFC